MFLDKMELCSYDASKLALSNPARQKIKAEKGVRSVRGGNSKGTYTKLLLIVSLLTWSTTRA